MIYLLYGTAIVLFMFAVFYSLFVLIDGSYAARCVSVIFWIVTFAFLCYAMVESNNKGPCVKYETQMHYTRTKPRTDYVFYGDQGERDSVIVIAQVSPQATASLVDEWRSLKLEVDALRKQIADRNAARLQAPQMSWALKENREAQGKPTPGHVYSNDYDMINIIVLGKKAKAYKIDQGLDPKANLRDCMTAAEIHAVQVLQDMNTTLIKVGLDYHERKDKLQDYFMRSLNSLLVMEVLELQS